MTFEEIPIRMLQLKVDRPWLCAACDYTPDSMRQILAPNGKGKTDKALRRIWEALDREEERQKAAILNVEPLRNCVVLNPTQAQFDKWMAAAYRVRGRSFDTWAKAGLDELASLEFRTGENARAAMVWTPEELALLGTAPDAELGRRMGRPTDSVMKKRLALKKSGGLNR